AWTRPSRESEVRRFLAILLMTGLVVACSKTNKRDNIEPPAELTAFTPTASVNKIWGADLGKGEKRLGLRQQPASDGQRLYAADPKGDLYAYDAASGATVWHVDTDLHLSSGV